jgi:hypothetical protein
MIEPENDKSKGKSGQKNHNYKKRGPLFRVQWLNNHVDQLKNHESDGDVNKNQINELTFLRHLPELGYFIGLF